MRHWCVSILIVSGLTTTINAQQQRWSPGSGASVSGFGVINEDGRGRTSPGVSTWLDLDVGSGVFIEAGLS